MTSPTYKLLWFPNSLDQLPVQPSMAVQLWRVGISDLSKMASLKSSKNKGCKAVAGYHSRSELLENGQSASVCSGKPTPNVVTTTARQFRALDREKTKRDATTMNRRLRR